MEAETMNRNQAREKFVLNLSDLEIISELVAGERSVEWRIPYICKKVGVASREELVRFAIDQKLPLFPMSSKNRP
jgi:DNA-binding NarL/FixJ family response regulator